MTRADLHAAGISDHDMRTRLKRGRLVKIARGLYLDRSEADVLGPAGVHGIRARHLAAGLSEGEALSHVSAAVIHGFDTWDTPLRHVHYTRPAAFSGRISNDVHVHSSDLHEDLVVVDGVPVTSVARTVVDLARTLSRPRAIVTGDSALRGCPGARNELPRVLFDARGRRGIVGAESVVDFLDGRSGSVGESLSRMRIADRSMPVPELRQEVAVRDGRLYRVDFLWRELGIVGEFDELHEYSERRDLVVEKMREDALRDAGFEVIRWNWTDLSMFDVVVDRFERAVLRSCGRRVVRLPNGTIVARSSSCTCTTRGSNHRRRASTGAGCDRSTCRSSTTE